MIYCHPDFTDAKICEHLQVTGYHISFQSNNLNQPLSVVTHQSLATALGDFCPLLLAGRSHSSEDGWASGMNCPLQVASQGFDWIQVWTLTGPFQSTNIFLPQSFIGYFAGKLIMLHQPFSTKLQLYN